MHNYWFPACASSQLKEGAFSSQVLDHKLVVFRDKSGAARILRDRCCHRGFPLSRGKMSDGNIACGYHGWEFNGSGQCIRIPSQSPDKSIPSSHCVPNYSCVEKDGYVWVWIGDESKKTEPPSVPEFHEGKWMQGSCVIKCNYVRALEITFDSPHVYVVHAAHPATVAAKKYGYMYSPQEVRVTKNGCVVFAPPAQDESSPIPDDAFRIEFSLPGQIRFELPMLSAGAYMLFWTTPLTADTCRMDWLLANTGFVDTHERVFWTGRGRGIIDEDRVVLELIQETYAKEGEAFERSCEADAPTMMLRNIVKVAESGEWDAASAAFSKRRIISMIGPAGFDQEPPTS